MSCRAFNRSASQVSEARRSRNCGVLLRGVYNVEVPQARSAEGAGTKVVTRSRRRSVTTLTASKKSNAARPRTTKYPILRLYYHTNTLSAKINGAELLRQFQFPFAQRQICPIAGHAKLFLFAQPTCYLHSTAPSLSSLPQPHQAAH